MGGKRLASTAREGGQRKSDGYGIKGSGKRRYGKEKIGELSQDKTKNEFKTFDLDLKQEWE